MTAKNSSRKIVYQTLEFNSPQRVPRQLWELPWAKINYPDKLKEIKETFPADITYAPGYQEQLPATKGEATEIGEYIDEWGCKFINKQRGVIGEVKEPLVEEENWEDSDKIHIPEELLTIDKDKVNAFCRNTDKFVLGGACPRPFERLQFIRGTEQLYMDLMLEPKGMKAVIADMHDYYCRSMEVWADTEVDALMFMDDWGAQDNLLIPPEKWCQLFKPLYRDYIDIAHNHDKKIFMHSDGHILAIIPHLIELGLDAVNSQLFCMGVENLKQFSGQITFWGEMDRQHLLPDGTLDEIEAAVKKVKNNLWADGGCIAQCEFGPGANPDNVYQVFKTWDEIL